RSATTDVVPFGLTRSRSLSVPERPCEQPAPDSSAYSVCPTNCTSATPAISPLPLDASLSTTTVLLPWRSMRVTRELNPPFAGPTGGGTCLQGWVSDSSDFSSPVLEILPPVPPSATYSAPSGPNLRPRGLSRPVTTVVQPAGGFPGLV